MMKGTLLNILLLQLALLGCLVNQEVEATTYGLRRRTKNEAEDVLFDRNAIRTILPQRPPAKILVDAVTEYEAETSAVGYLDVQTIHCQGHYPSNMILPELDMLEALIQLTAIIGHQIIDVPLASYFVAGVDGAIFKKPVRPGDRLILEISITKWNDKFGIFEAEGSGYVDGALAVHVDKITMALAREDQDPD